MYMFDHVCNQVCVYEHVCNQVQRNVMTIQHAKGTAASKFSTLAKAITHHLAQVGPQACRLADPYPRLRWRMCNGRKN
jgi:predicted alpha/beta-hydrolase family hydrolase